MRTVRYDPGDFPPLSPGSTLAGALAQALRQGRPLLPAIDREGRVIGVFDLPGFLARLSPRGRSDLDAPVGPLLEKAPVLVSPGLEDSWARDGASESAVVVDEAGRPYRGILFRDEGPTPPSAHDRVDAWLRQLSEGVLAGVSYMVAVADTAGRVVLANAELRRFFGEALAGDEPVLHRLFPPRALGSAGALGGWQAPRIHQHRGRLLLVFGFPLVVEGALRYVTLAIHDVSALVGEQLAQAHEDLDGLRRVLDVMVDGLMVVNRDGVITMINPSFEEIHGVPSERVIGRHVTDVIENTRMHIVAQTGIAEHGELQKIGERRVVVSRIPLYRDGRCVGAAGKIDFTDLGEVNRLAHKVEHLKKELEALRSRKGTVAPDVRFGFADIPALSPASRGAKESAMRAAPQNSTVLLLGESGVGKEVFAHSIHAYSTRAPRPFVRVNCSAIQETLFESELFGYEDGAFTGARKGGKQGKFEMADGGTIFLDEIGDMPLAVQAKLLRVLQEQEIEKVGSEQVLKVDVRVVAATNQDLEKQADDGRFRRDLYYRLSVIPIRIPPLRERREDIPELIRVFWEDLRKRHGIYHKALSPEAQKLLDRYEWPGNIRELHNVLERALTIVVEPTISDEQVRMIMAGARESREDFCLSEDCGLADLVEQTERRALGFALARTNNNRLQAAKLLKISRALLYKKLHAYGIA
ncbi:MAG: sigma 54-interacting transcriptional regulator [Holophagales bacterium]|nr:sigma 54-interacting transcriptional regulator [Holophagales bacterium]